MASERNAGGCANGADGKDEKREDGDTLRVPAGEQAAESAAWWPWGRWRSPAGEVTPSAVKVVSRCTPATGAELFLDLKGLAEAPLRRLRITGAEVERAKLVEGPCFSRSVPYFLRRPQRAAQRADEIEPAKRDGEQPVKRPREPKLLFETLRAVESFG